MECNPNHNARVLFLATPAAKANAGFSLIELLIVIAIMGIVLGIGTLNFHEWQVKNKIEAQTREILVNLNDARTSAFTQKRYYGIVFQPNSYVMKSYSSAAEASVPLTAGTTVMTRSLYYGLTKATASIADTPVVFDTSGTTFDWFTIFVNPYNSDATKESASVNCIVISTARVNMGKINGTACEFK